MYYIFIHSPIGGTFWCPPCFGYCKECCNERWGAFIPFQRMVFSRYTGFFWVIPGVALLDHMLALGLLFKEPPYCSPQRLLPISIPTNGGWRRFPFTPHSLQPLWFVAFFDDGHSDRCKEIPCSFDLLFSSISRCSASSKQFEIGFLKVCPVLTSFPTTYCRTFLKGRCHLQPCRPCEY